MTRLATPCGVEHWPPWPDLAPRKHSIPQASVDLGWAKATFFLGSSQLITAQWGLWCLVTGAQHKILKGGLCPAAFHLFGKDCIINWKFTFPPFLPTSCTVFYRCYFLLSPLKTKMHKQTNKKISHALLNPSESALQQAWDDTYAFPSWPLHNFN